MWKTCLDFLLGQYEKTVILDGADDRDIAEIPAGCSRVRSLVLCNGQGMDFLCEITQIQEETVIVAVKETQASLGEPSLAVTVYQGLPKSDKMDFIAQKVVEMGAIRLVPTMTSRCVSRPDTKSAGKKVERWAEEITERSSQAVRTRKNSGGCGFDGFSKGCASSETRRGDPFVL